MLKLMSRAYSAGKTFAPFTPPSAFTSVWDYTSLFAIQEKGRVYKSTFDSAAYAAPSGLTYYVDPVNGSDSNNGLTSETPFATVKVALDASNAAVIILEPGIYTTFRVWGANVQAALSRDIALICPEGRAIFTTSNNLEYMWVENDTYSNVYQIAGYSPTESVIDRTNLDSDGDPIQLKEQSSLVNVAATPNSFFRNSTALYIHCFDGRAPLAEEIYALRGNIHGTSITGNYQLYCKNISFWGGSIALAYNTTNGSAAKIITENCEFMYSSGNGFACNNLSLTYHIKPRAKYNKLDGLSISSTLTQTKAVFSDWLSSHNGLETFIGSVGDDYDNNCNSLTGHDNSVIISINGRGDLSDGPVVAIVGSCAMLALGTYAGESLATTQGSAGNDVSWKVNSGCSLYAKNIQSGASYYGRQNSGTFIDYGGYMDGSTNGDSGSITAA